MSTIVRAIATAVLISVAAPASAGQSISKGPDAAPWQTSFPVRAPQHQVEKRSRYITMSDGVRLAADIYLPQGLTPSERIPAILVQTRYYRSAESKSDPRSCDAIPGIPRYFASRGYAVVFVDVRGTGASFGTRRGELSADEQRDGGALVDWIVSQPWSSGSIGAWGQSYLGSAAELLLSQKRSAVKAVALISSTYDVYADLYFPGGILNRLFQQKWGELNRGLDSGRPDASLTGDIVAPCKVDGDADGALRKAAFAEHAGNYDSGGATIGAEFRDDDGFVRGLPSPPLTQQDRERTETPLLSIEGTTDSAYGQAGVNRQINSHSRQERLILGAGNHGVHSFYAPGVTSPISSSFDQNAEVLAFFDRFVAGRPNGYDRQPRVKWFTTGANQWRSSDRWPRSQHRRLLCLGAGRTLTTPCRASASEVFDPAGADAATGNRSRWLTTVAGTPAYYTERSAADAALLTYTSAPLVSPLETTGSAVLTLKVTNPAPDGDYFVFLEEVDDQGRAYVVSQGQIRASKSGGRVFYKTVAPIVSGLRRDRLTRVAGRKLTLQIGLLPISHRFAAGSRIRIAIAGSDKGIFDSPPLTGQRWTIELGAGGSVLTLPVVPTATQ